MNDSTLSLAWNEPLDSGGRSDLSYSVRCSVCRSAKGPCMPCGDSVSYRPAQYGLLERRLEVWGLLPHTTYVFTIQALNGVSQLSGKEPASTNFNITTTHDGKRQRGREVESYKWSEYPAVFKISFAICAVPSLVSVILKSDSTESSLTLHWTVPAQTHYNILQYQIRYCEKVRAPHNISQLPALNVTQYLSFTAIQG